MASGPCSAPRGSMQPLPVWSWSCPLGVPPWCSLFPLFLFLAMLDMELNVAFCHTPRATCVLFSVVTYEGLSLLWGPHSFLLV